MANGITNCDEYYRKYEVVKEMEECIYKILEQHQTDAIKQKVHASESC